jgi:hypothetical protein
MLYSALAWTEDVAKKPASPIYFLVQFRLLSGDKEPTMKRVSVILLAMIVFLPACAPEAEIPTAVVTPTELPTTEPNSLYVDPKIDFGPISPYLYGTNYGPMHAVTSEAMPYVIGGGFTALRFPGGAWTDNVDILPFQIDQFMDFCKQVGAIPTISVRLLGGTPEKAAELVRYANIEKKYGVVYWSIGNEPNIYTQMKYATFDYNITTLNQDWRPIALAMKAVDPSIKIMGPELSQWNDKLENTPKDSSNRDWMTEFLKVNGDLVDVVTVHRYPIYSPNGPVSVDSLRTNTHKWPGEIAYLHSVIQKVLGHDLPVAITELNSDPSPVIMQKASPDSFFNAIWYADVLGQAMKSDVFMVNQWVLSQRSTGLGLFNGPDIRPTYYVFPLYKNFGTERVFADSSVLFVDIFAAKRPDGTLTLMVINLADSRKRIDLMLNGANPTEAEVWLLDSTHNAENLGMQPFPADGFILIPPQSATLYVISPAGLGK